MSCKQQDENKMKDIAYIIEILSNTNSATKKVQLLGKVYPIKP